MFPTQRSNPGRLHCGCILYQLSHKGNPVVKNLPASAGDVIDTGSVPGLGRSPGEGHGNPLGYSCLENPMDRGAWWVTVHGVTKIRHNTTEATQHEHIKFTYLPV